MAKKPKLDWLKYVTTSRAKNKIKRSLKEDEFEEAAHGNEILRRKFRNWKIEFSDENIDKLIKRFKLSSSIDLYGLIYREKIDLLEIKRLLSKATEKAEKADMAARKEAEAEEITGKTAASPGDVLMISHTLDKVNYKLAKCCNPIPGDKVFGFVTISKGISIHRTNCPNAAQLLSRYHYRKINVSWKETTETASFNATIQVTGLDKVGMMNEILQVISNDLKANMVSVKIDSSGNLFTGDIKLVVKDKRHIEVLLRRLGKIKGVTRALRLE